MKRVLLIFLFSSIFLVGCSKDDNGPVSKTPADLLVENSPWVFDSASMIRITDNWNNRSEADLLDGFSRAMAGTKFTFYEDGRLKYSQDGYSIETTWEFRSVSEGNIDYTRLYFAGDYTESLDDVEVSSSSFSYIVEDCDVSYDCAIMRYHYK